MSSPSDRAKNQTASFTWLDKIVNLSMTKKLNYASPDWLISVN